MQKNKKKNHIRNDSTHYSNLLIFHSDHSTSFVKKCITSFQFGNRTQFCWVSLFYSLAQLPNFPFQLHLPGQAGTNVSHILPLQRIIWISSPHSRGLVLCFYTFILVKHKASFPERSSHGTGLMPGCTFQKPETATELVVTAEFLGELFPLIMGIFASDGT